MNTMKMKPLLRCLLVTLMIISFTPVSFSQESATQKSKDFWKRVNVGGYVSLQIGNVTGIVVSPEASVRLIDQLYGGLGFAYQYYWYKDYYKDYNVQPPQYLNYSTSVYGGRIFFRYYLRSLMDNFFGNLFAHTEYEYLYYVRPYKPDRYGKIVDPYLNTYSKGNDYMEISSIFIGGGYEQPLGGRAFLDILILFNLNDSYNSPYSNPVFRIGFGVGL